MGTEELLYKALLTETTLLVPINQLALSTEKTYYWVVKERVAGSQSTIFELADDLSRRSAKVEFQLSKQTAADRLSGLQTEEDYLATTEPMMRGLMEAQYLEDQEAVLAAFTRYQELLVANPNNGFLEQIYIAFLIRHGLFDLAEALLING